MGLGLASHSAGHSAARFPGGISAYSDAPALREVSPEPSFFPCQPRPPSQPHSLVQPAPSLATTSPLIAPTPPRWLCSPPSILCQTTVHRYRGEASLFTLKTLARRGFET